MPRAVHLIRPGMAPCIAAFWTQIIGCDATATAAPARCTVAFASGQQLVFEESDAAPPQDAYDTQERHAYHLAFYLPTAAAFQAAFEAAAAAGLLYDNPRFEGGPLEFASAVTWADAKWIYDTGKALGLVHMAGSSVPQCFHRDPFCPRPPGAVKRP